MHWGLTTFERKRIERIALDHPFFDTHDSLLTKKELRAILAQGPSKTGPQVIAAVKTKLGIEYSPATQKKRTLTEALRDASFVPSFRRAVALGILCVLLSLFMTFTAPGRAFAEELYSIIIDFVDGVFRARNEPQSQSHEYSDLSSIPDNIDSPQALFIALQCPIVETSDELTSFHVISIDGNSLIIRSKYRNLDGRAYVIEQSLYSNETLWGYGVDMNSYSTQVQSSIGLKFYGGSSDDGTNSFIGFTNYSSIQIFSKQLAISELAMITKKLYYTS